MRMGIKPRPENRMACPEPTGAPDLIPSLSARHSRRLKLGPTQALPLEHLDVLRDFQIGSHATSPA
jgi:hypothetical protein